MVNMPEFGGVLRVKYVVLILSTKNGEITLWTWLCSESKSLHIPAALHILSITDIPDYTAHVLKSILLHTIERLQLAHKT